MGHLKSWVFFESGWFRTVAALLHAIFIYLIAPLFYSPNLAQYLNRWTGRCPVRLVWLYRFMNLSLQLSPAVPTALERRTRSSWPEEVWGSSCWSAEIRRNSVTSRRVSVGCHSTNAPFSGDVDSKSGFSIVLTCRVMRRRQQSVSAKSHHHWVPKLESFSKQYLHLHAHLMCTK